MEYKTTTTKLSKNSREINSETVTIENDKEISQEIYIYIYTYIYIYICRHKKVKKLLILLILL